METFVHIFAKHWPILKILHHVAITKKTYNTLILKDLHADCAYANITSFGGLLCVLVHSLPCYG